MRLLTHNMLMCNMKACKTAGTNFPLRIQADDVQQIEKEFSAEFLRRMIPRLDWPAIVGAAADLNFEGIPAEMPADAMASEEFLRQLHMLLLQLEVVTGKLVCGSCSREYPIRDTIPNMLLMEFEL
eukprot:c6372_g1_i1.p1 GENE.c6372_g1_i1~~c6372_g1_i1.p1  ORF type:complete len:126 (+),score=20.96 c6372_g1_i1:41-418(+)